MLCVTDSGYPSPSDIPTPPVREHVAVPQEAGLAVGPQRGVLPYKRADSNQRRNIYICIRVFLSVIDYIIFISHLADIKMFLSVCPSFTFCKMVIFSDDV